MPRKFKTVDYEQSLQQTVTLADCLAPNHLARFIVTVIVCRNVWKFRVSRRNDLGIGAPSTSMI